MTRAAQALLDAYDPKAEPYLIVRDLPPTLTKWLGGEFSGRVISYAEAQRLIPARGSGPSSRRDLPTLIKRYTHAALQLKTGAFVNGALALRLHQNADLGALEAYAIVDLLQGFLDLRYFQSLAAALRKKQEGTPYHDIPLHPFGVIELSTIMCEPALPTESELLKVLRNLTRMDGRSTSFVFYEYNEKRPRDTPSEIVSLVEPCVMQPLALARSRQRRCLGRSFETDVVPGRSDNHAHRSWTDVAIA